MNPSTIVAVLLEDDQEDPKDFIQRDPVLNLSSYFGDQNRRVVGARHPNNPHIAADFEASCKESAQRSYVAVGWSIENTDNYADLGRGGFGQVFVFLTMRDVKQFVADLKALETAVTVNFDSRKARSITDKLTSRIAYSRPHGYSDSRGRS
jgi:hypothetical protein